MIRRERINGGSYGWAIVDATDEERPHILYAAFTEDMSPPFSKRGWRAYKGHAPCPQVTCTTIAEFCLARKNEGNLAYKASMDPDNRFQFDDAVSAEELYTEAIEMFRETTTIERSLKVSLYLNRAENRITRLQPLHRKKGWEARDEPEWERAKRDFLRSALLDCEDALDVDSVRSWCAERLADYKVPRTVEVLGSLPRNANGKVIKAELEPVLQTAADRRRA